MKCLYEKIYNLGSMAGQFHNGREQARGQVFLRELKTGVLLCDDDDDMLMRVHVFCSVICIYNKATVRLIWL